MKTLDLTFLFSTTSTGYAEKLLYKMKKKQKNWSTEKFMNLWHWLNFPWCTCQNWYRWAVGHVVGGICRCPSWPLGSPSPSAPSAAPGGNDPNRSPSVHCTRHHIHSYVLHTQQLHTRQLHTHRQGKGWCTIDGEIYRRNRNHHVFLTFTFSTFLDLKKPIIIMQLSCTFNSDFNERQRLHYGH